MGDKSTELDCALFGMLAQCVWNMPGSPMEQLINSEKRSLFMYVPFVNSSYLPGEFHNLKLFCERMKEKFWPDWDECLAH